jgi:tripartite-type tricarboxylate transporter receptor subunit TctC
MTDLTRRMLLAGLSSFAAIPARSDTAWPNRSIILVHGFPAGGPVDTVSRILAEGLSKQLGRQLVVEARPGAAGTTAAAQVARAAPDGHTLAVIPATYTGTAAVYKKLPYRPLDDFTMIGMIAEFPYVIVTHSDHPIRTVADLISAARSRTTPLTFGSPGQGSNQHLLGELFALTAKIQLQHVPYRGGAPALTDLLGKRIDLMIDPPVAPLPHIKGGTLRAIAISGGKRFFMLPDVPTIAESGFPGFDIAGWTGLVGPAGLPMPVANRLNSAVGQFLAEPSVIERINAIGAEPRPTSSDQFKVRVASEIERWTSVVASANIPRI